MCGSVCWNLNSGQQSQSRVRVKSFKSWSARDVWYWLTRNDQKHSLAMESGHVWRLGVSCQNCERYLLHVSKFMKGWESKKDKVAHGNGSPSAYKTTRFVPPRQQARELIRRREQTAILHVLGSCRRDLNVGVSFQVRVGCFVCH